MKRVIFILVAIMAGVSMYGEHTDGSVKQTVGLVLSGGGAKGIAHIGVIKALEDNDIPIDCITGTSMGAVIGSLYSCGYSPEEMMSLILSPDFANWSTGRIDTSLLPYYNEHSNTPSLIDLHLHLKDSVRLSPQVLPVSLVNPLPMEFAFMKLYSPYTAQCDSDFNRLFVPFRCVTSDVYHKHKIVCSKGSLGRAVRASMSFPMVYRPIEMDGVLVFDGGIYDNFPVDVMRTDFHPDIMIGVSVSGPDGPPQPDNIYSQLEDMIIQNNDYDLPASEGVKIQVPVLKFGVLDWDKAREIYDIGYQTGMSMIDSIKSRVTARVDTATIAQRRAAFRKHTPQLIFDSVNVGGKLTERQKRYVKYVFDGGSERPFGIDKCKDSYYRLIGTDKIAGISLTAPYNPRTGMFTLNVDANVKDKWSVGMGGWVTSSVNSMLYLSAAYSTLSHNSLDVMLSAWVGQSYWAGKLSGAMQLKTLVPSLIEGEVVASRRRMYGSGVWFYQGDTKEYATVDEVFGRAKWVFGPSVRTKAWVGFGGGRIADSYYPLSISDALMYDKYKTVYHAFMGVVGAEHYTLNNSMYPTEGEQWRGEIMAGGITSKFTPSVGDETVSHGLRFEGRLSAMWRRYFPVHKHFTIGAMAQVQSMVTKLRDNYTAVMLQAPAFGPTPATEAMFCTSLRAGSYVAAGVMPVWRPVGNLQVRGDFYLFTPIRDIKPDATGMARYDGWFNRAEFLGEMAVVYNLKRVSLSLYGNYITEPGNKWNVGISLGIYILAPKLFGY